jgi:phosphoglycerate kinase
MRSLEQIGDIKDKRVLVRLDLNVPIVNGKVTDDFRIRKSFPTLDFLIEKGARIILISHCEGKESKTLKPMHEYLETRYKVAFVKDFLDQESKLAVTAQSQALKEGEILLLENLRLDEGEKSNSPEFTAFLASLGDIYVNEAFSASHRSHASIVGVPTLIPAYAGFLFLKEVENLSKAFNPKHPFVFILGGAKFDTKIPLIKKFIESADTLFIGGALAHNFWKEKGYELGKSLVSEGDFGLKDMLKNKKIILPQDVVVKRDNQTAVTTPDKVLKEDVIVDAGPLSIETLSGIIKDSRFVLWNGPLGNFEIGYKEGTLELASSIAESQCESIVGGADTLSAISTLNLEDSFSFVSSGGGAMLDFLAEGTLAGIDALK